MFRSAVFAIKPTGSAHGSIECALAWSRRHSLALTAMTVIDPSYLAAPEPIPLGGDAFKHERDAALLAAARESARQNAREWDAACSQRGDGPMMVRDGDTAEMLASQVQEHDLLILGSSGGDDSGDASLLSRIVKCSPRPVIVLPAQPATGDDVVIAFDGSSQAARALASLAYSGIAASRTTHVVSCDADTVVAAEHTAAASRFLGRHGIKVQTRALHVEGSPAEALLAEVAHRSAGLLVMGAFGDSVVREFFFGSVTRKILRALPVPVMMDR